MLLTMNSLILLEEIAFRIHQTITQFNLESWRSGPSIIILFRM